MAVFCYLQDRVTISYTGTQFDLLVNRIALPHIYELAIGHWVAGDEKDFLGLITN